MSIPSRPHPGAPDRRVPKPLQPVNRKGIILGIRFQEVRLANLHSAIKRIRSNERKRVRNRNVRSRARSAVGVARAAGKDSKEAAIRAAIRELDKAASKGVIHKNNAARRKSRLLQELHSAKTEAKKK
jgi:small subunit ribosomal protein S20